MMQWDKGLRRGCSEKGLRGVKYVIKERRAKMYNRVGREGKGRERVM